LSEDIQFFIKGSYAYRETTTGVLGRVAPYLFAAAGKDTTAAISGTLQYNTLDNSIAPTEGALFAIDGTIAGPGGSQYYAKIEARALYFLPIIEDALTLKIKGSAGHIRGWHGKQVSVLDLFYKGGDTLRGFRYSGVGPHQYAPNGNLDAIGAHNYAIGSLEFNFGLGLPDAFGLQGALFTDFGTVFGTDAVSVANGVGDCVGGASNCTVFDSMGLRMSVGAGIVWNSPFGPMRLDVAYPLVKQPGDAIEYIRFSLGVAF